MQGVGHGTVLGGRYRLEDHLTIGGDEGLWRAIDLTLEREVDVRALDPQDPAAGEAVDAARRAALVDDPRLQRVLDVGTGDDAGYVVCESVVGQTVADIASGSPLPAIRARALVGEAARALDVARRRGLHHLRLGPASVLVTGGDNVRIRGLAVDAAVHGIEEPDAATASRIDAQALVCVLYAALTGRWPGHPDDAAGLSQAPLVDGLPVPPADLVPGVPADLDSLCAATLSSHGDGPLTPGELADQLAPWQVGVAGEAPRPQALLPVDPEAARPGQRSGQRPGQRPGRRPAATGPRVPVPAPLPDEEDEDSPFDDDAPAEGRGTDQAAVILVVVAVVVVVLLFVAIQALGGGGEEPADQALPSTTASATVEPEPTTAEPTTPTPTPTPTAAAPTRPTAAVALDPEGDGSENDDEVGAAFDEDPGSFWPSETYDSAEFGGLKTGVGIALDLGADVAVSDVTLTTGGDGGRVELRTAAGPDFEGSQVVADADLDGGAQLTLDEPVTTRWVVLWFTAPSQVDDRFRVELSDVRFTTEPTDATQPPNAAEPTDAANG